MISRVIIFFVSIPFNFCSLSKIPPGTYSGGPEFWRYQIIFKPDGTFYYSLHAHLKSDSTSGIYSVTNNGTILLKYHYTQDDSSLAISMAASTKMSIENSFNLIYSNYRADSALYKGTRIHYKGAMLRKIQQ